LFPVGLLGDRRPRVLPPMEILFKDKSNQRPVYDFQIKQEWEKHVSYQCPAHLTPAELKAIERVARETFAALDCRDVSRVDMRMTPKGELYVIEVNPLPGLTPGYSDLCLIANAAGIEYRTLIGEILEGGLKRLREKRREAKVEAKVEAKAAANGNGAAAASAATASSNGNGAAAVHNGNNNGAAHGNGHENSEPKGGGSHGGDKAPPPLIALVPPVE
jgi:D-alanine-D-alanine ligase